MPYWFDGNNLIGQAANLVRSEPETRKRFLSYLSSCSRSRGGRFLVFFDGDDPDRVVPPTGVRVRYSAPMSTDDAIVRELSGCSAPSEVIVVTNDHSLAGRCRDSGAKAIGWREFASKMISPSQARSRGAHQQTEPVNIDEWIRYFRLDKDSLE
jgi:predicted RNA-binding protein with PIN domain